MKNCGIQPCLCLTVCVSPGTWWGRWWTLHSVSSCLHGGGSETWLWSALIPPQEHTLASQTYTPGQMQKQNPYLYKQCSSLPCKLNIYQHLKKLFWNVFVFPIVPWPPVGLGQPGVTAGWPEHCGSGLWTRALLSQTWTGSPWDGWQHSGSRHSPAGAQSQKLLLACMHLWENILTSEQSCRTLTELLKNTKYCILD